MKYNLKPTMAEIRALAVKIKPQNIPTYKEGVQKGETLCLQNDNILLTADVLKKIEEYHSVWKYYQTKALQIEKNKLQEERNKISSTTFTDNKLITNKEDSKALADINKYTMQKDQIIIEAIRAQGALKELANTILAIKTQRTQRSFSTLTDDEKSHLTALEEVINEKTLNLEKNLVFYYNSVRTTASENPISKEITYTENKDEDPREWVNAFFRDVPSTLPPETFSMTHTVSSSTHFRQIVELISYLGSFDHLTYMATEIKEELKSFKTNDEENEEESTQPVSSQNYILMIERIELMKAFLFNKINDIISPIERMKICEKSTWFKQLLKRAHKIVNGADTLKIDMDAKIVISMYRESTSSSSSQLGSPSDLSSGTPSGTSISLNSGSTTSIDIKTVDIKAQTPKKPPQPPSTPNPHRLSTKALPITPTASTSSTVSSVVTSSSSSSSSSNSNTKSKASIQAELTRVLTTTPSTLSKLSEDGSDERNREELAKLGEGHKLKNKDEISSATLPNFTAAKPVGSNIGKMTLKLQQIASTTNGQSAIPVVPRYSGSSSSSLLFKSPSQIAAQEKDKQSTSTEIKHPTSKPKPPSTKHTKSLTTFSNPPVVQNNGTLTPATNNSSSSSSSSSTTSSNPSAVTPSS